MNSFSRIMFLAFTLATILCEPASARDIYKWTDAGGHVHYSDRPLANASQIEIREPAAPASESVGDRQTRRQKLLRAYEEEREIAKRQAAERLAEKELRTKNCVAARQNLEAYRNAQYLYDEHENGERRVLSFSEREEATKAMRESVDHWCNKS